MSQRRTPSYLWPVDRQRVDHEGLAIREAAESLLDEHIKQGAPEDLGGYIRWLEENWYGKDNGDEK